MKSVFYEGLLIDLQFAVVYKYETGSDNIDFKAEVRKLETILSRKKASAIDSLSSGNGTSAEMATSSKGRKACNSVTREDKSQRG